MAVKRSLPEAQTWGIEPAADAAEIARTRLDRVLVGHFPDVVPTGHTFDCIAFNDVLEHIADPWGALEHARCLLNPGGVVVASIPNVRHWDVLAPLMLGGRWNYTETGILDRTHLRFFTRSSVVELFVSCGYTVDLLVPLRSHVRGRIGRILTRSVLRWPRDLRIMQFGIVASPCVDRPVLP